MRGVTLMEIILISIIVTSALLFIALKIIKPQTHGLQSEISILHDRIDKFEDSAKFVSIQERLAYNEMKLKNFNDEILKLTTIIEENSESLDSDINDAHEHINKVFLSVKDNRKRIDSVGSHISNTVDVRIKNMKPMLVQMMHDQNLRTYTVEKVIRTKDGYKKKSMSRVVPAKKKDGIKKLNLPGVEAAKESFVQTGL